MISSLKITNFQSVQSAELALGKFTVIVGQTNSGKSAVVRALRMLAFNAQHGAEFVTKGKKLAFVAAEVDGQVVSLERGKSHSVYRVGEATFTKSGTSVPEEVSRALRITATEYDSQRIELQFATQFDKPFLLDEAGTRVAKLLGTLTNIDIIYAAIREANRRRLSSAGELKVRRADLEALQQQLPKYAGLKERAARVKSLAASLKVFEYKAQRAQKLEDTIRVVELSEEALARRKEEVESLPEVDVSSLVESLDKINLLSSLLDTVANVDSKRQYTSMAIKSCEDSVAELEDKVHELLQEEGTCPLCSQPIPKVPV